MALKAYIEHTFKANVRFEDDSTVYTLNTETITDEDAYKNAMNQYYYKQEQYDKAALVRKRK